MKKKRVTTDALEIIWHDFYEGRPDRIAELEKARVEDAIARKIYDLRENAGLTRAALAKKIGETAAVIKQLEEGDYDGHSLSMLNRIAEALNQRLELTTVPLRGKARRKSIPA